MRKTIYRLIFLWSLFSISRSFAMAVQNPAAGRIIGHIDGVVVDTGGAHVKGWACQQGRVESITLHIYANGGAYDAVRGTLVLAGKADLDEEPAVDRACQDTIGRKHRFDIPLPAVCLRQFHGMPLYVHGIRVVGNVENSRSCPDAQEHLGSIVVGVAPTVLIGTYRFPNDHDLGALDGPQRRHT